MANNIAPILIRAYDQTKGAFASVKQSMGGVQKSAMSLQGVMAGVFSAITVQQAASLADAYNSVNARLKLVSNSTKEYSNAQKELFKISQSTRAGFSETVDLFSTLTRSTKELNIPQKEMLELTSNINKALVVSGASGASAQAALTQLGQAFSSGVLRGEEFNSISEQAPVILDILSKGLNRTRGELRAMAADGKITTEIFLKGFAAGAGDVSDQFEKMPVTISGSMTRIRNSLMVLVGSMDKATGASGSFATSVESLSVYMDNLALSVGKNKDGVTLFLKLAGTAVGILAVAKAVGVLSGALIAMGVAASRNKALLALMVLGTAGIAFYDSIKTDDVLPANSRGKGFQDPRTVKNKITPVTLPTTISKEEQKEIDRQIKLTEELASQLTGIERQKRFGMETTYKIAEAYKAEAKATTAAYVAARNLRNNVGLGEQKAILDVIDTVAKKINRTGYMDQAQRGKRQNSLPSEMEAIRKEAENSKGALQKYAESIQDISLNMEDMALKGIKTMEDALVDLVAGTASVKDAFKSMARSVINDLIRMQIQKQITGPLSGALDSFFTPKAIGGPVQSGQPYMVGERGAEMFVPNSSGSIIPNNRLGGGGGTIVNQVINVTTGVQQTVRAEIMGLMPQIANAAKSAVADANLRGGSYRTAMR